MKNIDGVLVWGSDVEDATVRQAAKAARLPFVRGHVALMPDAHVGMGSTVGSVIPTQGAVIPAAVGVDAGCGMIAAETSIRAEHLPGDLRALYSAIANSVPAGVGKGHDSVQKHQGSMPDISKAGTVFSSKQSAKALSQFGTLGSGNHFVEVCLDERGVVWVVLHSGSRGIGNELAQTHIAGAKKLMKEYFVTLEDPDLAYLVEGTTEFKLYISDMLWSQDYAMGNREAMMRSVLGELFRFVPGKVVTTINCHHNYTTLEHHNGSDVWLTRKGAIRAREGDMGVIPGSMGTSSYIVRGLGNPSSYNSCSHGAGRKMSRSAAKRDLTAESLAELMKDKTWNGDPVALLDEHPNAYKDIDAVMADQKDLAEIVHTLHQVLNYKGV